MDSTKCRNKYFADTLQARVFQRSKPLCHTYFSHKRLKFHDLIAKSHFITVSTMCVSDVSPRRSIT